MARRLTTVGTVVFAPTILFLSAHQNILLRNRDDLRPTLGTGLTFLAGFTLLVLLQALLVRAGRRSARAARLGVLLPAVAVAAMGWNVTQGWLGGAHWGVKAVVDLVVIGLVLSLTLTIRVEYLQAILGTIGLLILLQAAYVETRLYRSEVRRALRGAAAPGAAATPREPAGAPTPAAGNVYHIVLDGFQGLAFDRLRSTTPAAMLQEFTWFPRFRAAYGRTHFSLPSVLQGEHFTQGQDIRQWTYEFFEQRGLWRDLHDHGVPVHVHAYYPYYCPSFAAGCDAQLLHARQEAQRIVVDLWFLSLLPASMRDWLDRPYRARMERPRGVEESFGFSVTEALLGGRAYPIYYHAVHSVRGFERLLQAEDRRPPTGQYVFYHALLPHGPHVYDADCRLRSVPDASAEGYLAQARCALRLVERLRSHLISLGRYDRALVIVHADHGMHLVLTPDGRLLFEWDAARQAGRAPFDLAGAASSAWPSDAVESTADALFLVKPPAGTSILPETDVQVVDIAPTILHHFGIPTARYAGRPVQQARPGEEPRPVLHFTSRSKDGPNIPSRFSTYRLRNGRWTYEGDINLSR